MKKFLILILPLCVILFILMWISWGLERTLIFFIVLLLIIIMIILWMMFIDKHIKD